LCARAHRLKNNTGNLGRALVRAQTAAKSSQSYVIVIINAAQGRKNIKLRIPAMVKKIPLKFRDSDRDPDLPTIKRFVASETFHPQKFFTDKQTKTEI